VKAESITPGQKIRAKHDVELSVILSGEGPGNQESAGLFLVAAGTVLIAVGGAPGASAINVYPENYDELKPVTSSRASDLHVEYGYVLSLRELKDHFELL
jgi:hypothetical protein